MFDAEPSWPVATVGEVADILDSRRVPLNSEERRTRQGPYPYWGANGVVDYIDAFLFDEPLVLMAEDGGYFADAATKPICHLLNGRVWVNNHAHVIRPTKVDRDFFYYWFVHRDITPFIKGGTRTKLNQADLKQLPISVPPLTEQQRIVGVLRSIDRAISTALQASRQAETARDTLITSAFDVGGDIVSLSDACSLIYRYPGFYGFEQKKEGVPVVRGEHLRNGKISTDFANFYFVEPAFSAQFPKTVLQTHDVVMSVRGTVGTTAAVDATHVGSQISPNLIRLVANPERLLPPLLYYAVQSAVAHMRATIVNAQALPAINAGDLKKVEVALPPLDRQHDLLRRLQAAADTCLTARKAAAQLFLVRSEVANDLLSGRVRVPA